MTSLFACGRFSKSRGLSASVSFLPSFPFPFPLFYSLHSSPCNSLLPNCTETLATQATLFLNGVSCLVVLCHRWLPKPPDSKTYCLGQNNLFFVHSTNLVRSSENQRNSNDNGRTSKVLGRATNRENISVIWTLFRVNNGQSVFCNGLILSRLDFLRFVNFKMGLLACLLNSGSCRAGF